MQKDLFFVTVIVLLVLGWMAIAISAYFAAPVALIVSVVLEVVIMAVLRDSAMAEMSSGYVS